MSDVICPKCGEPWDAYGITYAKGEGDLTLDEAFFAGRRMTNDEGRTTKDFIIGHSSFVKRLSYVLRRRLRLRQTMPERTRRALLPMVHRLQQQSELSVAVSR